MIVTNVVEMFSISPNCPQITKHYGVLGNILGNINKNISLTVNVQIECVLEGYFMFYVYSTILYIYLVYVLYGVDQTFQFRKVKMFIIQQL